MTIAVRLRPWLAAFPLAAIAALHAGAEDAAAKDGRKAQEIVFPEIPEHSAADDPFDVSVSASSGLPVALEVVSGPAVMDGRRIRLTGFSGLVIVSATQDGNARYLPARRAERVFGVRAKPSAPTLISPPSSLGGPEGGSVILAVEASGEPPPSYQWRRNGVPIAGANNRTLTLSPGERTAGSQYDVVVSNPFGSVTGAVAFGPAAKRSQTVTMQPPSGNFAAGQSVQLVANASSGLPVQFEIVSGAGSISGSLLTSQGGTVSVRALQSGDAEFAPAESSVQIFNFVIGQSTIHP